MSSPTQAYHPLVLDEDYFRNTLPAALASLAESLPTATSEITLTTFRSEWRKALYRMADDPSTEPEKHITTPGGREFSLLMVPDLGQNCCSCCMDVDEEDEGYYPPPIVQSDTGVTRRQFIRTIADTIYGEDGEDEMPADWTTKLHVLGPLEHGRVWPVKLDWMVVVRKDGTRTMMGDRIFVLCKGIVKAIETIDPSRP